MALNVALVGLVYLVCSHVPIDRTQIPVHLLANSTLSLSDSLHWTRPLMIHTLAAHPLLIPPFPAPPLVADASLIIPQTAAQHALLQCLRLSLVLTNILSFPVAWLDLPHHLVLSH